MKKNVMQKSGRMSKQFGTLLFMSTLALMLFFCPTRISAQKFFFVVESRSTNVWSSIVGGYTAMWINKLVTGTDNYSYSYNYEYGNLYDGKLTVSANANLVPGYGVTIKRWNDIKYNGDKTDVNNLRPFGFKCVDLFRDFEYSLKFGWQPRQIPVGVYAKVGYRHENFNSRIDENNDWTKHRINTFRPGIGIKISPFENLLAHHVFCPVFELGSSYNIHFSYKGGKKNDVKELNNGISIHAAVGAKMKTGTGFFLRFEKDNYDLFNKDYTINGVKPYEGYSTNRYSLIFSIDVGL